MLVHIDLVLSTDTSTHIRHVAIPTLMDVTFLNL